MTTLDKVIKWNFLYKYYNSLDLCNTDKYL